MDGSGTGLKLHDGMRDDEEETRAQLKLFGNWALPRLR